MARSLRTYFSYFSLLTSCREVVKPNSELNVLNWAMPLAGHKLDIIPLATETAKNYVHCVLKCTNKKSCISINLGRKNGEHVCEMLGYDRYVLADNLTKSVEWTFGGVKVKMTLCYIVLYQRLRGNGLLSPHAMFPSCVCLLTKPKKGRFSF